MYIYYTILRGVHNLGRKRTSNKERITISVDKDLVDRLRKLGVARSVLFTDAAKDYLDSIDLELTDVEEEEKDQ